MGGGGGGEPVVLHKLPLHLSVTYLFVDKTTYLQQHCLGFQESVDSKTVVINVVTCGQCGHMYVSSVATRDQCGMSVFQFLDSTKLRDYCAVFTWLIITY